MAAAAGTVVAVPVAAKLRGQCGSYARRFARFGQRVLLRSSVDAPEIDCIGSELRHH